MDLQSTGDFVKIMEGGKSMQEEKTTIEVIDSNSKSAKLISDIKYMMISKMLKFDTDNAISEEELDDFFNYLSIVIKPTKSRGNADNRINGLLNLYRGHYTDYKKVEHCYSHAKRN